jgi:hypothetical protein
MDIFGFHMGGMGCGIANHFNNDKHLHEQPLQNQHRKL